MVNERKENNIDIATKLSHQIEINSKFTKEANNNNAPKSSDVNNMIKNISKKEGE